ncbi:hypothetical protein Vafri_8951 [Volvox africanus]|uniref:Uncharacterized protein n=1 Tax=Volvox africanus TaxID=51714 RepID=A0A8J4B3F0_9CHLO|nr:hypothetical protein Vafri_8951 [Volvox africanus]
MRDWYSFNTVNERLYLLTSLSSLYVSIHIQKATPRHAEPSRRGQVEPLQQLDDGGLATTRRSHQRHHLPCGTGKGREGREGSTRWPPGEKAGCRFMSSTT